MQLRTWLIAAVAMLLVAVAVWLSSTSVGGPTLSADAVPAVLLDTTARAPDSMRIRVRVLNGTETPGLARRGMQLFRDYGYDVVDYATAPERSDSSIIEVDAGSAAFSDRIRRVLGGPTITVRERATPLPYVDVTVTLGADWKPPAQPFRP